MTNLHPNQPLLGISPIRRGEYLLISTSGEQTLVERKPTIDRIQNAIGATCLDTVNIDRRNSQIMMVDDTGMLDGKPVNELATQLYRAICRPGTFGFIHGNVAIVNDEDFA
jgi:hypothetical protein